MKAANRIIVITGASRGLGKDIALRLCRQNPEMVLVARTEGLLTQTQTEIANLTGKKPLIIPCDVSREADVNRLAEAVRNKFQRIDVLINNAGMGIHKIPEETTSEEMRNQFAVNFYGPFYCIKALLPLLKRSNAPYILNIGSLTAKVSFADNCIYASTKSALANFSDGLRQALKKYKIKVGLFMPGMMNTSFQDDRQQEKKPPAFLILNSQKAAGKIEKMIYRRSREVYMYRWMLLLMKLKKLAA